MAPDNDVRQFLQALWPEAPENGFSAKEYVRFVDYLRSELSLLQTLPGCFAAADFAQELRILRIVKRMASSPQHQVLEEVGTLYSFQPFDQQSQARCQSSVELAVRIWVTINVDSFNLAAAAGQVIPPPARTAWDDSQTSLQMFVQNQFPSSTADQRLGEHIPSSFNVVELCSRSKYHVRWTHNFSEHLKFKEERDSTVILVYEHLICLLNHGKYSTHSALPKAIVEEAIDTFILLFPLFNPKVKSFLKKEERWFYALGYDGRKRQLQLNHYHYWRESIAQMMAIMAHPPRGWRQAILDNERRNFEQVVTIWVGAFATILTVVALVFGLLSTLLALEANKLAAEANALASESLRIGREANKFARDAYELDRRQACLSPNATEEIPQFCP